MKIYTKGGDKGKTSLVGGSRISKYDTRLHAYGTADELNAWLGLIADTCNDKKIADFLRINQSRLFDLGSNLASEKDLKKIVLPTLGDPEIKALENEIDRMQIELPELRAFILPGGDVLISYCHLARTVCRRAERWTAELTVKEKMNPVYVQYLNRMSDYLFVLARYVGHLKGVEEIKWKPNNH